MSRTRNKQKSQHHANGKMMQDQAKIYNQISAFETYQTSHARTIKSEEIPVIGKEKVPSP